MGFFANSKDRVMEGVILPVLNNSILQPYGKATSLRIDSTAKTLDLELQLKGETELLHIRILSYELLKDGAVSYVVVRRIGTSRAWLTTLAEQHLVNRRLELPARAASILERCL